IKARPVAGDRAGGEQLLKALRPFVYRRYLDYGAFESLRGMKTLIEQQLHRNGYQDNIKLGAGGIREIEFIAQAFQLIRGGHDRALQQRSLMPVFEVLERDGLLPEFAVRGLREAYVFLRRAENRLQAWQDQQTHELPRDDERRQALALAMGFQDWGSFHHALNRQRRRVHQQFEQVFAAPHARDADEDFVDQVSAIWEENVGDAEAIELLKAHGLPQASATLEFLHQLRRSPVYRGLGEQGRRRFSQLLPLLFGAVQACDQPETALLRVLHVIEAIAGRTTYLALLVESPMALSQLLALCAASPWITHQISHHPLLLDELLDPRMLYRPAPRAELERELEAAASTLALDDLEAQMDLLRRLKQAWVLRVAAADVNGSMRLMVVSDHLTDIAGILVGHALKVAWRQMVARHGQPLRERGGAAGFAVIAYGKLGGLELGYGSDLDLVFVHDGVEGEMTDGARAIDHGTFFTRLGQKIIHILTAQMPSGVAYAVDMRLRPSGNSGLLVTSLEAYRGYQLDKAWTWEHQALVRACYITGSTQVGEAFEQLRREVLCRPRDDGKLREEIRAMRQKMHASLGDRTPGRFDLKHGRGGITDIEFMVQYAVLRDAAAQPELVRYSDNIRQLDGLERTGTLVQADAVLLADAYRAYRKRVHALT
ncbi:MAG: bifunctional [glutamate--ammonia ligase]-adenylyl-L-tyrosine phosphorylase/[glutamate--ammonia-ligase] adenylyltransferase, partial [Nevskiales bacterium]